MHQKEVCFDQGHSINIRKRYVLTRVIQYALERGML